MDAVPLRVAIQWVEDWEVTLARSPIVRHGR